MTDTVAVVNYGLSTLAVLASSALVVRLWRQRDEPTAGPLLWMACALVVYAAVEVGLVAFGGQSDSPGVALLLFVGALLPLVVATCWLLFTLQYTGRTDTPVSTVTYLLSVQLLVSGVVIANGVLATLPRALVQTLTLLVLVTVLAELLGSSLLLVSATIRQAALPFRQGALLAAGPFMFVLPIIIATAILTRFPAGTTVASVRMLPIGLTLSAACVLLALSRYRVFETLPVATRTGREQVLGSVSRGVVVLDRQQQLHDCNARAEDHLDIDRSDSLHKPIDTVQPIVPDLKRLVTVEQPVRVQTPTGSLLLLSATEVRNERDQLVGYALTTRDVTRRYNRERRLEVLNQFLADVTHERMETIAREVTALADGEQPAEDHDEVGGQIWDTTTELATLVARTREIEETLASKNRRSSDTATDVTEVVRTVVEALDDDQTNLVTRLPDDRLPTTIDETLVDIAVRALLEAAVKTGATVAVEAQQDDPKTVEFRITTRSGQNTEPPTQPPALGELAVEVARLAIDSVGGSVTVETGDRTQTVHVALPTGTEGQPLVGDESGQQRVVQL